MASRTYSVICQNIVGNEQDGFSNVYGLDEKRFDSREAAIRNGFSFNRGDDFNIGVWEGDKLVSVDWFRDPVDTDPALLHEIQTKGEVRL